MELWRRTGQGRSDSSIKDAWPDLHYQTVNGALVVLPSPPAIPPAPLHLVAAGIAPAVGSQGDAYDSIAFPWMKDTTSR